MSTDVLQPGGQPVTGSVTIAGQPVAVTVTALPTPVDVDPTDDAARLLGIVTIGGQPVTVDLGDDATRVLGVVSISDQPLEVTTDADDPPLVAVDDPAPGSATARWQDDVAGLLARQTEALEAIALEITS